MSNHSLIGVIYKYTTAINHQLSIRGINSKKFLEGYMKKDYVFKGFISMYVAQIGELVNKLPEQDKQVIKGVNFKILYKTRNIIYHDYDSASVRIIASLVFDQVLPLNREIKS